MASSKAARSLLASPGRKALVASGALLLCAYLYSLSGLAPEAAATISITITHQHQQHERSELADLTLLQKAAAAVQALKASGEAALAEKAAAAAAGRPAKDERSSSGSGNMAPAPATTVGAAVMAGAGLHGFVDKQGPLDPKLWRGKHKGLRDKRLLAWMLKRQGKLDGGKAPPPLPLTASCQVWVNHRYRALYLRHAKTASSSLFCHFNGCREGGGSAETSFVPLEGLSGSKLEDLWRDYFVVTFVRSPYTRSVSSYKMMARNLAPQNARRYGWNDFCADPAGFVGRCLADPRCKRKGAEFVLTHIQPQHACMLTAEGGLAVDFIGRTEHIDEDLTTVLAKLEKRRLPSVPSVKPLVASLDNVNGRGCNETAQGKQAAAQEQYCDPADYFRGRHAACFQAVQQAYRRDVEALQFGLLHESQPPAAEERRRRQR